MDIRVAVTVLGVLLTQALGHPRAAEEPGISSSADSKIVPLEVSTTKEVKKSTFEEKEVPLTSLGSKLKNRLLEESKLPTSSKEVQDEAVRSPRQLPSPLSHQMSFSKAPHTTTVCIQVHSAQQPQVICGPQYAEREDLPSAPSAARFASPYEYVRAAPQGYAQAPPAPARGFPSRRAEEEQRPLDPNFPQPASGHGPQNSPPTRLINSVTPVGPVYVQNHAYRPAYSAGPLSPLQALMKLNCAVEPTGQYLSPQFMRGSPLGYPEQSLGDAIFTLPDGSAAKFGANHVSPPPAPIRTQNNFITPQQGYPQYARSSAEEDMAYLNSQMLGSSQNYPAGAGSWNYGAYLGESYPLEMMQARSASGEDGSQAYLVNTAENDYARRELLQLQALRESKERLRDIQEELIAFRAKEELQKMGARNASASETSKDPSGSDISIDIKATKAAKTSKRHTRT